MPLDPADLSRLQELVDVVKSKREMLSVATDADDAAQSALLDASVFASGKRAERDAADMDHDHAVDDLIAFASSLK